MCLLIRPPQLFQILPYSHILSFILFSNIHSFNLLAAVSVGGNPCSYSMVGTMQISVLLISTIAFVVSITAIPFDSVRHLANHNNARQLDDGEGDLSYPRSSSKLRLHPTPSYSRPNLNHIGGLQQLTSPSPFFRYSPTPIASHAQPPSSSSGSSSGSQSGFSGYDNNAGKGNPDRSKQAGANAAGKIVGALNLGDSAGGASPSNGSGGAGSTSEQDSGSNSGSAESGNSASNQGGSSGTSSSGQQSSGGSSSNQGSSSDTSSSGQQSSAGGGSTTPIQDCSGKPYHSDQYTCYESKYLCPVLNGVRTLNCEIACYDPSQYG